MQDIALDNLLLFIVCKQETFAAISRHKGPCTSSTESQQGGGDAPSECQAGDPQAGAEMEQTNQAQEKSTSATAGRPRSSVKRSTLGFAPLRRKQQANMITPPPPAPPARVQKQQQMSLAMSEQSEKRRTGNAELPIPPSNYGSPGNFRTPAAGRLPAPGQCMEAALLHSTMPTPEVPTNMPTGKSNMRCLTVQSPQPMQARRQWGILSLQQQAGGQAAPQEGNARQAQQVQPQHPAHQQQPRNRALLAEQSQNDSDFAEAPRSRGFQGAAFKRRTNRAAPVRNSRSSSGIEAKPLDITPEARCASAEHIEKPSGGQPVWRRKGLAMQPAKITDQQTTGLQLSLHLAACHADSQGMASSAAPAAQQSAGEAPEEAAGIAQPAAGPGDRLEVSEPLESGGPAGESFVPETCLPALSLPASDAVPDTPDAKAMPSAGSAEDRHSSAAAMELLPRIGSGAQHSRGRDTAAADDGLDERIGDAVRTREQPVDTVAAAEVAEVGEGALCIDFGRPVLAAVPSTTSR